MKEGVKEEGGHFQSTIILPWPQGYMSPLCKMYKRIKYKCKNKKTQRKKKKTKHVNLHDLGSGSEFLNMTTKAQATKG